MLTIRWLREQMRQGKSIFDLPLRVTRDLRRDRAAL